MAQIMDVKSLGAKGDGVTDDGSILNVILQNAANLSSIVYFSFGMYVVKDTLNVPVGSRIIGQAWSQIMAKGAKFQDKMNPRVMVKVGQPGDGGVVEIQDMLFTVFGNTAGAVLMVWNVHESNQGSSGLWDSHFRVGGAIGTDLQSENCPKLSGYVNPACKAASLLLHMTAQSPVYMENVWVWVADHDLDKISQDQIDIYVGRGVLIESHGPTWLYGTASEHCVLHQYQLSGAKNIVLGMIQTESPYFQPMPKAPQPFTTGLFKGDPTFDDCDSGSATCAVSWAFSRYSQDCLKTEDCQQRGFFIEQTNYVWIYNLCTKAIVEMVSPVGELVSRAVDNRNGFISSILAWVRNSSDTTIGERKFEGFQIYRDDSSRIVDLTTACQTATKQRIKCHEVLEGWQQPEMRGSLDSKNLTDAVCDAGCGRSLRSYYDGVVSVCHGQNFTVNSAVTFPARAGGTIWTGYNETCLEDPDIDVYCNNLIDTFKVVDSYEEMPQNELCSWCYVNLNCMMRSLPYSIFQSTLESPYLKARLEYMYSTCGVETGPTDVQDPQYVPIEQEPIPCFTDVTYTSKDGDTCDSVALTYSIASAALQSANTDHITNCTTLAVGNEFCIPLTCHELYILEDTDTCESIELDTKIKLH